MDELKKIFEEQMYQKLVWLNQFHTQDKIDILSALKENFGEDVIKIVERVECEKAQLEWQHIASQTKDNSIEAFIQLFWEPLRAKGFEFTCEPQKNGIQMRCIKCPAFELAKKIDATEWLYHHTCSVDEFIVSGFNPQIGFKRTKTLMQGDTYCNHYYYMK